MLVAEAHVLSVAVGQIEARLVRLGVEVGRLELGSGHGGVVELGVALQLEPAFEVRTALGQLVPEERLVLARLQPVVLVVAGLLEVGVEVAFIGLVVLLVIRFHDIGRQRLVPDLIEVIGYIVKYELFAVHDCAVLCGSQRHWLRDVQTISVFNILNIDLHTLLVRRLK